MKERLIEKAIMEKAGFLSLQSLEEFITNPDNKFITDKERNAFYIIAECINKYLKYSFEI